MKDCRSGNETSLSDGSETHPRQHYLRYFSRKGAKIKSFFASSFAPLREKSFVHSLTNDMKSVMIVDEAAGAAMVATSCRPLTRTSVNTTSAPQRAATSIIAGARITGPAGVV